MHSVNVRQRKESESSTKHQVQMKAWRKKNSTQLSEFQSLYGSLNGSFNNDEAAIGLSHQFNRNVTNNQQNLSNSQKSRSINRESSQDSFFSIQSLNNDIIVDKTMSERELQDEEEFKSMKDYNSMSSQTNQQLLGNNGQYQIKNTIDEERDSSSSMTNYVFHTPKYKYSDTVNDESKVSFDLERQQQKKNSNINKRSSDASQNYKMSNQQVKYGAALYNNHISINNRISDTSSTQEEQSSRSSILNHNHPLFINGHTTTNDEIKQSLGEQLLEKGVKKQRNSVSFGKNNEQEFQQNGETYKSPQYINSQNLSNNSVSQNKIQQDKYQTLNNKKNPNRGKSLSTLKKMIDQPIEQQQNNQNNSAQEFKYQGNIYQSMDLGKTQGSSEQSLYSSQQQSSSQQQQSQYNQKNIKKYSYTVLQTPSNNQDELFSRKVSSQVNKQQRKQTQQTQQKSPKLRSINEITVEQNRNKSSSIQRNISLDQQNNQNKFSPYDDQYYSDFLYYKRQNKKQQYRIAHNNRLIERKKHDIKSKPSDEEQQRCTLNLTLIISIILEKHPNLKYFLFLNHMIGAISRGFVYFFLIIVCMVDLRLFSYFVPCIFVTRLYYIVSMYYVLFYPEQKSVSFRKISKIFNNFFYLPLEYKKPVMSEMIDVMDKSQRDKEEKSMKIKFVFCPAEINYLCLSNQDSRKKWNLFYISNFIYQGIESFCLYPLVICFTIYYYSRKQVVHGFDFLVFSRYIMVGALSIFALFCLFLLIYGNKKFRIQ